MHQVGDGKRDSDKDLVIVQDITVSQVHDYIGASKIIGGHEGCSTHTPIILSNKSLQDFIETK